MATLKSVSSSEQLGVSNVTLLRRGLLNRCPACGSRGAQVHWFKMEDRCPHCDLKFERIEGHAIGYIGINTIVTFAATFVVLMVGSIVTHPDIAVVPILVAALITSVLLPLLFLPSARTFWTGIDLVMRPLSAGEIDPRFVVIDPEMGDWGIVHDDT